ncbi:restriction endonuclease subunit S [Clostridium sp. D2Q-14]|uniref:restriction endonuclease subunit S n=1 Tax=Anaeromonas gelatinilytica TaxID=2683194 RepID=UPI00193C3714|nr:restriction endonuclease subunit S [Anaeromonas gelatinilytica]MBS4536780.1 restriction endonuclease subunit S [Anaeromonas gelatinilytica]
MRSNEWKSIKISNLCRIRRGASPRPIKDYIRDSGIPWVKIADATSLNSRFINETKQYIKIEGKKKSRYIESGTLILSNSATPGLPKIMGIDACVHDGWLIVDEFDGVEKLYLYYSFINERERLLRLSNGSVFRNLKTDIVKNYTINLPPLSEQKAIANILSTLDEKIEINNQINKKQEEMAQEIFKHWFVDFEFPNEDGQPYKSSGGEMVESELGMIPKGWEVKKLLELNLFTSDYVANGSFKSLKDNVTLSEEQEYAVFIRNTDLKNKFKSGMKYVDKHSYEFLSKTKLYGDEVIISNVADVGSVYLCPELEMPMTLGNNVIMLKSEINSRLNYYFYRLFKSKYGQYMLKTITSGSAQMKFNKTDFRNLKIAFPNDSILNEFLNIENAIENSEHKYDEENRKLQNLRDTLLPKLMSREIRVPLNNEELEMEN